MDNSLLAVRVINHKYIVVERRNDRLWQKTLKTMAVRKEIMRNMKGM